MCYSTNAHSGESEMWSIFFVDAHFSRGKSQVKGYSWWVGENEDQGTKDKGNSFSSQDLI